MRPLNCKIQTVITVPLDENIEEERDLMMSSPVRGKGVEKWNDGILIEIQPVTSKYVTEGYHNEQTSFYAVVWDATDLQIKTLPLNGIRVGEREIDRMMKKEWGN
jgi:hypothetical protein